MRGGAVPTVSTGSGSRARAGRVKDSFKARSYGRAVNSLKTLLLVLVALVLPSTATAATAPGYAPGQVIVKFRPSLPAAERSDALRDHGAALARTLPVARTAVARIPDGESVAD